MTTTTSTNTTNTPTTTTTTTATTRVSLVCKFNNDQITKVLFYQSFIAAKYPMCKSIN